MKLLKKLSKSTFQVATNWILENGRELDQTLMQQLFFEGTETAVLVALAKYQNEDGGFGNGLEADIRMPNSSPLATTVAMQLLTHFDKHELADVMISKSINYFENTFDEQRDGWYAVPENVNHYPHAFWWSVHEDGMSWIDHHWGNPSAEIIGYLFYYQTKVKKLSVDRLLDQAINYLLNLKEFKSEHEIYCYIRLFTLLPEHQTKQVREKLELAVQSLVNYDETKWKEYLPSPLKFVQTPEAEAYGIPLEEINKNLDFLIGKLETNGIIKPNWEWNKYLDVWEQAKIEWAGNLTFDALKTLQSFNRIKS